MVNRRQFGATLFEHQALRMRVADLQARSICFGTGSTESLPKVASICGRRQRRRVTAARLGEEVLSECMHIFGSAGYLVDETSLGRWWRDMKLARVGGGTDEVLWELVAAAMKPDYDGYAELIGRGNA